ncbi:MAG: helix-turn-helix domain-containing protein [Candidatus Omnitrophota bacterium]|nr:helix-turn-helix domain-containing protein [Candidatus Omnitrophota bacterium]
MIKLLKPKEVAKQLRISNRSVAYLAQSGKIPGAFRVGKHWRFKEALLIEWINDTADGSKKDIS